ncbi:MAG: hypothetical protein NC818_06010 [Candidatus Omnitrophica bacterium]|nr:hypothetical protein [Candidatus Omnitrophota bacterium]MCM8784305.1 hypothetical protein [Candidatus Omnitrophota bacterium]
MGFFSNFEFLKKPDEKVRLPDWEDEGCNFFGGGGLLVSEVYLFISRDRECLEKIIAKKKEFDAL